MEAYVEVFKRRKWVVVLTAAVTFAVVTIGTFIIPPRYSASATLRVAQLQGGSVDYATYMYAERLMNTYVEILRSRPILEQAIQKLGLGTAPKDLGRQIKVEALPDTELIRISVESDNPWRARDIANALAALIIEQSQTLYAGGSKSAREILEQQLDLMESDLAADRASLQALANSAANSEEDIDGLANRIALEEETYAVLLTQYEQARVAEAMHASSITIVEPAVEPEGPSKPNRPVNIGVGALIGLLGGAGLAFLFENVGARVAIPRVAVPRKRGAK